MAALKCFTAGNGAQCVMILGISKMLMWCAVSLVSAVRLRHHAARDMVRELTLSGWITSHVMERKIHCLTVRMLDGETKTVAMARIQVWSVTPRSSLRKRLLLNHMLPARSTNNDECIRSMSSFLYPVNQIRKAVMLPPSLKLRGTKRLFSDIIANKLEVSWAASKHGRLLSKVSRSETF